MLFTKFLKIIIFMHIRKNNMCKNVYFAKVLPVKICTKNLSVLFSIRKTHLLLKNMSQKILITCSSSFVQALSKFLSSFLETLLKKTSFFKTLYRKTVAFSVERRALRKDIKKKTS